MILPISAYGSAALRKPCSPILPSYPDLHRFIDNLWHTLDNAEGVGLAAPQVNQNIQLFIVHCRITDSLGGEGRTEKEHSELQQVFINPKMIAHSDKLEVEEEGCLSIPDISIPVKRFAWVEMTYMDERFQTYTKRFYGRIARIIQHEYDHLHGKLPIDYLNHIQKLLLNNKLDKIRKGKIIPTYPMRY